jgi:hypothetical protein
MQRRGLFLLELAIGLASTGSLLVTLLWNDWIELAFGMDPDNYSGALEWLIVAACFVVAATFFALARAEWRKVSARVA